MSRRAWMPMYWGDYLKDTAHLTTIQHGAYMLLIAHCWQYGSIPLDKGKQAAIANLSQKRWGWHSKEVLAFFDDNGCNKRVKKELERAEIVSVKRKLAGAKGGYKAAIARAIVMANATAKPKQLHGSNPSNWSSNRVDTNKERKKEGEDPPKSPPRSLASALPSGALANGADTEQAETPKEVWREKPVWLLGRAELEAMIAAKKGGGAR